MDDSGKAFDRLMEKLGGQYTITRVISEDSRTLFTALERCGFAFEKRLSYAHDYTFAIVSAKILIHPWWGDPSWEEWPVCLLFFPGGINWKKTSIDFFFFEDAGDHVDRIRSIMVDVSWVKDKFKFFNNKMPKKARKFFPKIKAE